LKKFLILYFTILLTVIFTGCASEPVTLQKNQKEVKEIRVGTVPLPFYSHMWVAYKKGFIDEELQKVNYKLNWQTISLGPVVSESFAADKIDMGVMGDFPAFVGRSAGIDYRMVAIASTISKSQALLTKKDSGINMVSNLKGKKVATTKNTSGHELLISLIERNGMSINDVEFVNMSMGDLGTALINGDVDAGVMWEPAVTRLEESGEVKVVVDGTVCPNYAVLLAKESMINDHPEAVKAVLKAYQRGNEYMQKNPEECLKLLAVEMKIPEEQLRKMMDKYIYYPPIDDKFIMDMRSTEQFLLKNSIIKNPVDINLFIFK